MRKWIGKVCIVSLFHLLTHFFAPSNFVKILKVGQSIFFFHSFPYVAGLSAIKVEELCLTERGLGRGCGRALWW